MNPSPKNTTDGLGSALRDSADQPFSPWCRKWYMEDCAGAEGRSDWENLFERGGVGY